jgi:hypothetical protein
MLLLMVVMPDAHRARRLAEVHHHAAVSRRLPHATSCMHRKQEVPPGMIPAAVQ